MPEQPPHTVFVSHAHADNDLCDRYVAALHARGLDVWYDRANMQEGHFLSQDIETQLRARTAVVLLVTPASLASYWVRLEVGAFQSLAAQDPTRILLPVRIAECDMPLLMMGIKWIDAVGLGFDAAIDALAKVLRAPDAPSAPVRESAEELLKRSGELFALNKYAEAIPVLERATQRDPQSFQAWRNLGRAYIETGEDKLALVAFDRALSLDESQMWVWHGKGNALLSLGRYEEAVAAYDRVLVIDSVNTFAWNGKAKALLSLGRYKEALDACDQVLTLDSQYARAWKTRSIVLFALGRAAEANAAQQRARDLGLKDD